MSSVDYASPQKAGAADPNAQKRNEATGTLGFKEKLGYGLGDTASHFVWDMVGFWLLFFYTDVYKIPAAAAGTIMLVARFWDMAIDPVFPARSSASYPIGRKHGGGSSVPTSCSAPCPTPCWRS